MIRTDRQFATFHVGEMYFGIEVLQVQELIRYQEITPVPLAISVVEGLMNLRGQIVTAIDMRRRLGLAPREANSQPMNIVVRSGEGVVSLLVDGIGDVLEPPAASYEEPPATLRAEEKDIIECVCKLDGKLLLVLDTERLLRVSSGNPIKERLEAA